MKLWQLKKLTTRADYRLHHCRSYLQYIEIYQQLLIWVMYKEASFSKAHIDARWSDHSQGYFLEKTKQFLISSKSKYFLGMSNILNELSDFLLPNGVKCTLVNSNFKLDVGCFTSVVTKGASNSMIFRGCNNPCFSSESIHETLASG